MNAELFRSLTERLLATHYGLSLSDTALACEALIASSISGGIRPYQVVNDHAAKYDLCRIDSTGNFGVPSNAPLSLSDEIDALLALQPAYLLTDQPTTCPRCGARTEFDYDSLGRQHHRCLDTSACGFEFMVDDDEPLDESSGPRADASVPIGSSQCSSAAELLDDRYAGAIIGDRSEDYDAIEIHGVRNMNAPDDPTGTCCEIDHANPEFFSVYVHNKSGGVDCIGDFGAFALAAAYAANIAESHNWPVTTHVPERLRKTPPPRQ